MVNTKPHTMNNDAIKTFKGLKTEKKTCECEISATATHSRADE